MQSGVAESIGIEGPKPQRTKIPRWPILIAGALGIVIIGALLLHRFWPFTRENVIQQLQLATSTTVQVADFHRTFFPPGCVLDTVVLRRGTSPASQATMNVSRIIIIGSLPRLFARHLALIQLDGAHAVFPTLGKGTEWKPTQSSVIVDKLVAKDALLDFASANTKNKPVRFVVHEFIGSHLADRDPMKFEVHLRNPIPPGEIEAKGSFGPWKMDDVTKTPVAGTYVFHQADLGVFKAIGGFLSSTGKFQGTLNGISVEGDTKTPHFSVRGRTHKLDLSTDFNADVDPGNGDVVLHRVVARVGHTTILSSGSVASQSNRPGKAAAIDMAVLNGRIQDLLLMFVSEKQSPLNGPVSIKARAFVPPGEKPFLKKLRMTGDFGIADALFANRGTQQDVEKLSATARGKVDQLDDPESVLSDLRGHVIVEDGIATFSDLSFRVPGAHARLHGTYDLVTDKIDLHGILSMDASLPKATSGVKSFFLKALNPFLKKNHRGGAKFPVSIKGTYQQPQYSADPV
jgi:AsmA-like C-terminal region